MNKPPTISVIVPIYNAAAFLHHCIDSITQQSFRDFELILVDDGSKDKSGEICDEYVLKDKRIQVVHQQNGGVSKARNTGLAHATGEFVAFVDADDNISPHYLEDLLRHSSHDLVIGGYTMTPSGRIITIDSHSYSEKELPLFLQSHIHRLYFTVPWGKLYKRAPILEHHILFDTHIRLAEDLIFNLQYLKYCQSVCTVSAPSYIYNEGSSPADEKYNMATEELVYVLDRCKEQYVALEERFHVKLSNHTFKVLAACYPLSRIYSMGTDEEYFDIYQRYTGEDNHDGFYQDLIASPVNKTIYAIVHLYRSGKQKRANELVNQLSVMYGNKVKTMTHPSGFYRMLYHAISKGWFSLAKLLLLCYSKTKKS